MVVFDSVPAFIAAERELADVAVAYGPPTAADAGGRAPVGERDRHGADGVDGAGELPPADALYGGQGVKVGTAANPRFSTLARSFA